MTDRTNAERQRRYIQRLKAAAAAAAQPNAELVARDRHIKALNTRVRNLQAQVDELRLALAHGAMNFKTLAALSKALHPDHVPTDAERAEAFKLFSDWKATNARMRLR